MELTIVNSTAVFTISFLPPALRAAPGLGYRWRAFDGTIRAHSTGPPTARGTPAAAPNTNPASTDTRDAGNSVTVSHSPPQPRRPSRGIHSLHGSSSRGTLNVSSPVNTATRPSSQSMCLRSSPSDRNCVVRPPTVKDVSFSWNAAQAASICVLTCSSVIAMSRVFSASWPPPGQGVVTTAW